MRPKIVPDTVCKDNTRNRVYIYMYDFIVKQNFCQRIFKFLFHGKCQSLVKPLIPTEVA